MEELRSHTKVEQIGYIGTKRGLEAKVIPRYSWIRFFKIRGRGFARNFSFRNIIAFVEFLLGMVQTFFIILRFRPGLIIGTGGYVSFPPLFLGMLLRRKTIIHEQNLRPGFANRLLAPWVDLVLLSYAETAKFLSAKRMVVTGNPVRREILESATLASQMAAKRSFGLDPRKRTVLVFGGSKGAERINKAIIEGREFLGDVNVLLIAGQDKAQELRRHLNHKSSNIVIKEYIDRMGEALALADLVVCRAGATTLAEITALGKPAILIPWSGAAEGHQELNARLLEQASATKVLPEEKLDGRSLAKKIAEFLRDEQALERMGQAAKRLGVSEATAKVLREVEAFFNE